MSTTLTEYLNKRLYEEKLEQKPHKKNGPVITISRQVGCNGLKLAGNLVQSLNQDANRENWKVLSKEIFYESGKKLDLKPEKIRQALKRTEKYTFDEILSAFNNRKFKSERLIAKSVIDIVRRFSVEGFCIIVGRAGHVIAKDIENALHIRLYAPLEYRIQTIMENNKVNRKEAINFIDKMESERDAFRKIIRDESVDDDLFDIYINRASFNDEETIHLIEQAIDRKHILEDFTYKIDYY